MTERAFAAVDPLRILAGHAAVLAHRARRPLWLHLNPGPVAMEGWLRIGILPGDGDLDLDLRFGLPFDDDSVELIYAWRVTDRLGDLAVPVLVDAARILQPTGRLRLVGRDRAWAEAEVHHLLQQGIMPLERLRDLPPWSAADLRGLLAGVGFRRVTDLLPDTSDDRRLVGLETRHGLPADQRAGWFVLEAAP